MESRSTAGSSAIRAGTITSTEIPKTTGHRKCMRRDEGDVGGGASTWRWWIAEGGFNECASFAIEAASAGL